MIAAEFKNTVSTIRIHDEYCEASTDLRMLRLSRIVSDSYRRRQLSDGTGAVAAANTAANTRSV